jgi:excisionase family DNA binding protein
MSVIDLPKLWTEEELAVYLDVTTQTLYRERKRGRLGSTRAGANKVRFTAEHIHEYLRNRECPATSTKGQTARTGTSTTTMTPQETQGALALAQQIVSSPKRSSRRTSSDETTPR